MQHLYGHYDNRGICFAVYVVIFTPIFLVNCFLGFDYYFSIFIFFNVHVFSGHQIVLKKLMLSGSLAMLFLKMEEILNLLTLWKNFIPMLLGGAFIMDGSYKGCDRKLQLYPSNHFSTSII